MNGGGILIFKKGVKAVSDVKMGDVQDGWIGCWGKKWFWYVFPRQDYSFDLSSNITSNFTIKFMMLSNFKSCSPFSMNSLTFIK